MSSDSKDRTDPEAGNDGAGGSRRDLMVRVLIGAIIAPILMLVALTIFDPFNDGDGGRSAKPSPPAEPFRVQDGRIVSPSGGRFVVRGVTIPYGTFAGGDSGGLGARNYDRVGRDFDRLKRVGVNTVRILVTPRPRDTRQLPRLHRVVALARERGLVVVIGPALTTFEAGGKLLRGLARRYRNDSAVWFLVMKDPNCSARGFVASCLDWSLWRRQHDRAIAALRAEGVRSPVVVNTPDYSKDLTRVDSFPLADANVVLGVHRYSTTNEPFTELDRREERRAWADRSLERAVIVDEVGGAGPALGPFSPWVAGFLDFVADWTRSSNGSGAIGFVWRWSDANTMTAAGGVLTPWGEAFVRRYLNRDPSRL